MVVDPTSRNLRLDIAYKGTHYAGWQRQPTAKTVQGELERALTTVLNRPTQIMGAGRTDSGVHAKAQVATCTTDNLHVTPEDLVRGVNALLAPDIRLQQATEVNASFHALRSAQGKVYRYFMTHQPIANVFMHEYVWQVPWPYDKEKMRSAMQSLLGEHDFRSFATHDISTQTTVRTMTRVQWVDNPWGVDCLEIQGSGFLRHMVRVMVGTLMDMAQGRVPSEAMPAILKAKTRSAAGQTAPAQGLFLWGVLYGEE
jgi:tRNA pseudouridine38-40 synthase